MQHNHDVIALLTLLEKQLSNSHFQSLQADLASLHVDYRAFKAKVEAWWEAQKQANSDVMQTLTVISKTVSQTHSSIWEQLAWKLKNIHTSLLT